MSKKNKKKKSLYQRAVEEKPEIFLKDGEKEKGVSMKDAEENAQVPLIDIMEEDIAENIAEDVSEERKSAMSSRTKKRILLISGGIVGLLLIVYLGLALFFQSHFTFGTRINGVVCTGKTVKQAEEKILEQVENYKMHITGREDFEADISGNDIDLKVVFDGELKKLKERQNPFGWIASLFGKKDETVGNVVYFNEESLTKQFEELSCVDNPDAVEPVNATLVYEKDAFQVVPEKEGTVVDKDVFKKALWDGITNLEEEFSMEEKACYKEAALKADSEELLKVQDTMNNYLKVQITYSFGASKETVDKEKISSWISMNDAAEVVFDQAAVRSYIDTLGDKYNTYGKKRSFQTSYNQVIEITQGHYGWRMNREDETLALIEDIKSGESKEKEPLYLSRAVQYGENDIGNTYVEVNLTAQHVFLYKDGNLVIETDCVTGKLTKDRMTPEGIDSITYKDKDTVLRGADYASHVSFWMPFNGNVGLHDATWRNKFGGSIYKDNGSHGCVNLPYSAAKKIYENVEAGTPVIVYSLPGTESHGQDILTPEEEEAAASEGGSGIYQPQDPAISNPTPSPEPTQAPAEDPATAPTTAPATDSSSETEPSSSEVEEQNSRQRTMAAQQTEMKLKKRVAER